MWRDYLEARMGQKGVGRLIWFLVAFVVALIILVVIVVLSGSLQEQGESGFQSVIDSLNAMREG